MGGNLMDNFYVYTYSYPDGTPFYVGKGRGRRKNTHLCDAKSGRRQHSFTVRVISKILKNKEMPVINKIVEGVDEELAFFVEEEYIKKYGRRDLGTGILTNETSGGDGISILSPEKLKVIKQAGIKGGLLTRFKKGLVPWNKGLCPQPHVLEALRNANIGKKQSETSKAKKSLKLRGYVHKIITCPNCGKSGGETSIKRWHFDKCSGTHEFRARITWQGKRIHLGRFTTQQEASEAMKLAYKNLKESTCQA